ncbi:MAG: GGDEF domain-containing protein, partial [Polyangiaceae bacterium]|nr:GGDEF domain-containing protein [Polyangiaceae bacterium]
DVHAPRPRALASLASIAQAEILSAASTEDADACLTAGPVDVVVTTPDSWGVAWVNAIPVEARPAVVLTGAVSDRPDRPERTDWPLAEADEWITDSATDAEMATRLRVAVRRARLRRRAVRRGNVDPLTDLPNRRGVMIALLRGAARSRRQGSRLSLVLLDLDNFKRVNEQQGHDAGDRVLRRVGRILRRATRQDEVCGRIGGDEFVVVVVGDAAHGDLVARRLAAALLAEGISATSASAELAPSESLRELYRRADAQLRTRKRTARPLLAHPSLGH